MSDTLNVDSAELNNVGTKISNISSDVRSTYDSMKNIIEQVTSHESWKGAASDAFLDKFENLRPTFEEDLQQLEDLGPALVGAANSYSEAEESNVADVKEGGIF